MRTLERILMDLFPIERSLMGEGAERFLDELGEEVPLRRHSIPTGTKCFDWVVPPQWVLHEAVLADVRGKVISDASENILHVFNYCSPVDRTVSREELLEHCVSAPWLPDAIPYRTTYYEHQWGLCLTEHALQRLKDPEYSVRIRSEFVPGNLMIGEARLDGRSSKEVVLSSYFCHPRQANDGLSGVVLLLRLYDLLRDRDLKYSYRFMFLPETIGSLAALATGIIEPAAVEYALVATCVGAGDRITYKKTFLGDHSLDHVVVDALRARGCQADVRDFWPAGSDERQLSSPGVRIPTGSLMRVPYDEFPEYHTSADDLEFVSADTIEEMAQLHLEVLLSYEAQRKFRVKHGGGEPFLAKHGLYRTLGGAGQTERQIVQNWILHMGDGSHNIKDVAVRAARSEDTILESFGALRQHGIVEWVDE